MLTAYLLFLFLMWLSSLRFQLYKKLLQFNLMNKNVASCSLPLSGVEQALFLLDFHFCFCFLVFFLILPIKALKCKSP